VTTTADTMSWLGYAACVETPEAAWVPSKNRTPVSLGSQTSTCRTRCPVRRLCAGWALELESAGGAPLVGIWGGVILPFGGEPRRAALAELRSLATGEPLAAAEDGPVVLAV